MRLRRAEAGRYKKMQKNNKKGKKWSVKVRFRSLGLLSKVNLKKCLRTESRN